MKDLISVKEKLLVLDIFHSQYANYPHFHQNILSNPLILKYKNIDFIHFQPIQAYCINCNS